MDHDNTSGLIDLENAISKLLVRMPRLLAPHCLGALGCCSVQLIFEAFSFNGDELYLLGNVGYCFHSMATLAQPLRCSFWDHFQFGNWV